MRELLQPFAREVESDTRIVFARMHLIVQRIAVLLLGIQSLEFDKAENISVMQPVTV